MAPIKRIPIEINFEGKKFDFYSDNDNQPKFDFYLLKSKANELLFSSENRNLIILTSKFPTGQFGCGFLMNGSLSNQSDESNGKCYANGIGSGRSFKTEFDAQVFIINYVLKNCLNYSFYAQEIRLKLQEFINPKTLF